MNLSLRSILRMMGLVFVVLSLAMIPSLVVAVLYAEEPALFAFVLTIAVSFVLGGSFFFFGKPLGLKLKTRDGFFIITLCWVMASILSAVPFVLSGSIPNVVDAFFESCSGFSTTGASVLTDVESLPRSILFWRSFTGWMGGIGILVSAVAIFPTLGLSGQNVALFETPGVTLEKATAKTWGMIKDLCLLFILMTTAEVLLLRLGGLGLYDSLIHSFGTVSTGGFSTYNDNVGHFDSPYVMVVITIFMFLASVNFNLYFLSLRRDRSAFLRDSEFKFYLLVQILFTLFVSLNIWLTHTEETPVNGLLDSAFQTTSLVSTTGYSTTDYTLWPTFSQMLLLLLLFIGGCSSSAGGGLKAVRFLVLLRLIRRAIATRLHPQAVVIIKLNKRDLPSDVVSSVVSHLFLYLLVVFFSSILLSLTNFDLITGFTSVISCVGNVGSAFGVAGPASDYGSCVPLAKLLLSFLMVGGRLELFTLLILLTPRFWNPSH